MHRIDVSSASPTLPQSAAAGAPGYWTDGDLVANVPATVLDQDFFNALQEELIGVIVAAGIAPAKGDHTQLLQAITKLLVPASSLQANGYIKLVGGLIIQWGTAPLGNGGSNTIGSSFNFPIPFPNAVWALVGSADNVASGAWSPLVITFPATSLVGSQISADTANTAQPIAAGRNVRWIAIGR